MYQVAACSWLLFCVWPIFHFFDCDDIWSVVVFNCDDNEKVFHDFTFCSSFRKCFEQSTMDGINSGVSRFIN